MSGWSEGATTVLLLPCLAAGLAGACAEDDDDTTGDGDADSDGDGDGDGDSDGDADGDGDAVDPVIAPYLADAEPFVGEGKVPGMALAILEGGRIHIGTLGVRREGRNEPVTRHTLFRTAIGLRSRRQQSSGKASTFRLRCRAGFWTSRSKRAHGEPTPT